MSLSGIATPKRTRFKMIMASTNLTKLNDAIVKSVAHRLPVVAFSGGVDSTVVLAATARLFPQVKAVFVDSPLIARAERDHAEQLAPEIGIALTIHHADPLLLEPVRQNQTQRCYVCKHAIFSTLGTLFNDSQVIDGTNADDMGHVRPGKRALEELGVVSPLALAGLTKTDIRNLARELRLSNAEKPSAPCLATRFPYDFTLTSDALAQVEKAERLLTAQGYLGFRVRIDADKDARLEFAPAQLEQALANEESLVALLKEIGYQQVSVDKSGYRTRD